MKKIMVLTSVASMIDQFTMPHIRQLLDNGYSVDVACNFVEGSTCSSEKIEKMIDILEGWGIKCCQIDFSRNILNIGQNLKAYRQVYRILKSEKYVFLHSHSPIGGLIGRISGWITKTRVIYTAHGFHFFAGAPLINWLIYFPVEWICSFFTDVLITINKEDFAFAKKHLHAKRTEYVHGVGADADKIENAAKDKNTKRTELGIPNDHIAVLSVGELNVNKNHEAVLRAIASLDRKDITYVICGKGDKEEYLRQLAKDLGMENRLILLGFRTDAPEIYKCCDIFAFPSFREGLPVSLMEAMLAELPVVGSDIRGIKDLTQDGKSGFLYKPEDINGFAEGIDRLSSDSELRQTFGEFGKKAVVPFVIENVKSEMQRIYDSL